MRISIIPFILFYSLIPLFFPLWASSERNIKIEEHYRAGYELAESKEFPRALLELNLAMRYMRHFPNHPDRKKVEDLIESTKERMVVERYRQQNQSSVKRDDHLLPIKFEPDHFRIKQIYGKVYIRKIWKDRENISEKEYIGEGRQVTVLPNAGIEIEESRSLNFIIRSVDAAGFSLVSSNTIQLHSGSMSLCATRPGSKIKVQSNKEDLTVSSNQPFALFLEVGMNGGLHATSLLGKITLNGMSSKQDILPGESMISSLQRFDHGRVVDLGAHSLKSKLLGGFKQPPVFYSQLVQQARMQMRHSKSF